MTRLRILHVLIMTNEEPLSTLERGGLEGADTDADRSAG